MSAIPTLSESECYLHAILDDPSGIELAEFTWVDEEQDDGCFRVWDFQWALYRNESTFQIDHMGRSLGKSVGLIMRACAFPFCYPGQEMLITAPELNHLRPVTDKIEHFLRTNRIQREMLPRQRGNGINHQPQFQVHFANNARIISRLPNRDGRGVKGSVCGGSLIMSDSGMVPVEDVKPGTRVLTHRGRYMPVLHVYSYEAPTVMVAGMGHRGLQTSENHRVLGRRNRNPQRTRNLDPATWVNVDSDEIKRWYWSSPTEFPELPLPDPPEGVTDGVALLSLAGSYAADGYLVGTNRQGGRTGVGFADEELDVQRIEKLLAYLGIVSHRRPSDTCPNVAIYNTSVAGWLDEHFGHRAEGKRLPAWLLGAPRAARHAFLDAYLAGDGHWDADRERWEFGSASKALAIGVKLLAQSLGAKTTYSWVDPKVAEICGVELKSTPQRSFRVQLCERGTGLIDDGHLWGKVRSVEPAGEARVYDLVVAEDHSYVGDGLIHLGSAFLPDGTEA